MDMGLLEYLLIWVLSSGSGVLAYWLIEKVRRLRVLDPEPKRYVAYGLSGVFAVSAYMAQLGMGYAVVPVGWQAWVESLVAVIGLACGVSQLAHARVRLGAKRRVGLGYVGRKQ